MRKKIMKSEFLFGWKNNWPCPCWLEVKQRLVPPVRLSILLPYLVLGFSCSSAANLRPPAITPVLHTLACVSRTGESINPDVEALRCILINLQLTRWNACGLPRFQALWQPPPQKHDCQPCWDQFRISHQVLSKKEEIWRWWDSCKNRWAWTEWLTARIIHFLPAQVLLSVQVYSCLRTTPASVVRR